MKMPKLPAFTALELLLVVTILAVSLGFLVLYEQGSSVRTDLQTQVALFVSELRLLESNASAGKNPGAFGVHLDMHSYVTFEGNAYDPLSTSNKTTELPQTIFIQNIELAGSAQDIIFTSPLGETLQNGELDFYSEPINKTITVTVNNLGHASY